MPAKKKSSGKSMAPVSSDRKLGSMFGAPLVQLREEKHALDRMSFWTGLGMMLLSGVLLLHGVDVLTSMTTALGGSLALLIE